MRAYFGQSSKSVPFFSACCLTRTLFETVNPPRGHPARSHLNASCRLQALIHEKQVPPARCWLWRDFLVHERSGYDEDQRRSDVFRSRTFLERKENTRGVKTKPPTKREERSGYSPLLSIAPFSPSSCRCCGRSPASSPCHGSASRSMASGRFQSIWMPPWAPANLLSSKRAQELQAECTEQSRSHRMGLRVLLMHWCSFHFLASRICRTKGLHTSIAAVYASSGGQVIYSSRSPGTESTTAGNHR